MTAYHDEEWGVPVHDDQLHFEYIVLEAYKRAKLEHCLTQTRSIP